MDAGTTLMGCPRVLRVAATVAARMAGSWTVVTAVTTGPRAAASWRRTVAASCIALLGALTGPASTAAPAVSHAAAAPASAAELVAFKAAIRKLYDLKERAWAAGDAETIVTRFYAPDAVSIGEGDPSTLVGRDQFRATYRKYVKDVTAVRIESVRTVVNGNAGWDWTNFYATVRPEKAKDYPPPLVRVLFLWSKEGGRWVCKGDVFVNGGFKEPL